MRSKVKKEYQPRKDEYPTVYGYSLNDFDLEDFISFVADYESDFMADSIRKKHTTATLIKTLSEDTNRNPQWLLRKYLFLKHFVLDANRLL